MSFRIIVISCLYWQLSSIQMNNCNYCSVNNIIFCSFAGCWEKKMIKCFKIASDLMWRCSSRTSDNAEGWFTFFMEYSLSPVKPPVCTLLWNSHEHTLKVSYQACLLAAVVHICTSGTWSSAGSDHRASCFPDFWDKCLVVSVVLCCVLLEHPFFPSPSRDPNECWFPSAAALICGSKGCLINHAWKRPWAA